MPPCAVTGIPDDARGERLVALYVHPDVAPAELWQRLAETDLPRLWLPKRENLYRGGCASTTRHRQAGSARRQAARAGLAGRRVRRVAA